MYKRFRFNVFKIVTGGYEEFQLELLLLLCSAEGFICIECSPFLNIKYV